MRTGLVYVGAGMLVLGIVVFGIAAVGAGQASAAFMNCLNSYPGYPMFGVPSACTDAMSAFAVYQGLEAIGGVLGLVGVLLLVLGLILQPEGPAPAPIPFYPPPVYAPPQWYVPPQGPQSPPPQP